MDFIFDPEDICNNYVDQDNWYHDFMGDCRPVEDGFEKPRASFYDNDLCDFADEYCGFNIGPMYKQQLIEYWHKYYYDWIDKNWDDIWENVGNYWSD